MFGHLLVSLLFAGVATGILGVGLRFSSRPLWALFLVLCLAVWAGGIWLAPFGPSFWNIYWAPFLLISVLVALLIVAIAPPRVHTHAEEMEREREIEMGLGVFFWILIGLLLAVVVLRYV